MQFNSAKEGTTNNGREIEETSNIICSSQIVGLIDENKKNNIAYFDPNLVVTNQHCQQLLNFKIKFRDLIWPSKLIDAASY